MLQVAEHVSAVPLLRPVVPLAVPWVEQRVELQEPAEAVEQTVAEVAGHTVAEAAEQTAVVAAEQTAAAEVGFEAGAAEAETGTSGQSLPGTPEEHLAVAQHILHFENQLQLVASNCRHHPVDYA